MVIKISANPSLFLNKIVLSNLRFAKYLMSADNEEVWVLNPYGVHRWPSIDRVFDKEPRLIVPDNSIF